MIREVAAAITGNYPILDAEGKPDCVIGRSFGWHEVDGQHTSGKINYLLAGYIAEHADPNVPWLLQSEIAQALPPDCQPAYLFTIRTPETPGEEYLDSWGVLQQAYSAMAVEKCNRPLIVAQAHHVGRVAAQAARIGMTPVVRSGLPREFDRHSAQWWTRSRLRWASREVPGLLFLRCHGLV
jgi:hypothetical protein